MEEEARAKKLLEEGAQSHTWGKPETCSELEKETQSHTLKERREPKKRSELEKERERHLRHELLEKKEGHQQWRCFFPVHR